MNVRVVIVLASLFYSSLQEEILVSLNISTTKRLLQFFLFLYNDRTCLDGRPEAGP
jgi:hypothetical protein